MSDQMQQGITQTKQPEGSKSATALFRVVVDNDAAEVKKINVAKNINAAKYPVIIISEKEAESLGQQAAELHSAFRNCAFVFETEQAEKTFYAQDESMAYYIHHQTIGILDRSVDADVDDHPALSGSDHIVVLGHVYSFHEEALCEMAGRNQQKMTSSSNPETPVDLSRIIATQNEARDFRAFAFRYRIGMA
jgi:hypothetical protein